jgi:Dolichyl-phosphate-mannose-protein mannosyltransferase
VAARSEALAGTIARRRMLIALAVVAGIVLRVVLYRSTLGDSDSDEAILGLMTQQAVHGHVTTFQWGEAYGGSQEVILTAPLFWIFGQSLLALRIVPVLLCAVAAGLVWRVGRRTIGEPAALVAAALFWLWPPVAVYETSRQAGFYGSNVVYAALILLLALDLRERPGTARVALFGLVAGLGCWQTSQVVPVALTSVVWLVWQRPGLLRVGWAGAAAAVVGVLPWIVWNAGHGWGSLHLNPGADFSYVHRLRLFVSPIFPNALGLRVTYTEAWIVPKLLGAALYAALVALFLYGAYRARRNPPLLLLYLTAAAFPFLYALSPKATLVNDPRYVVVLAPCLALLLAQLAHTPIRAAALLTLALTASAVGLHSADTWLHHGGQPQQFPLTPRSITPLIETLDRLRVDHVFTNYWIAYRLDFDSHQHIVAVENGFDSLVASGGDVLPGPDPRVRYKPYDREVRAARHGFVFFESLLPRAGELATLTAHGYTRHVVQEFVVYAPPRAGLG